MILTDEVLKEVTQEMTQALGTNILYKYRADNDYTREIIKNHTLWFSRPKEFNDPFDCFSILAPSTDNDKYEWLKDQKPFRNSSHTQKDEARKRLLSMTSSDIKHEIVDKELNKMGICCFNKTEKESLMWSHYSDSHKGLCFQFDITKNPELFILAKDVKYVSSIEPIDIFKDKKWKNKIMSHIIIPKYNKWSYEKEVRVIKFPSEMNYTESDTGKPIEFKLEALKKIIFGCKASEETISSYQSLCEEYGFKHVKFSKMQQKLDGSFELEEKPL